MMIWPYADRSVCLTNLWYEPCPICRIYPTCWPVVQGATTVLWLPSLKDEDFLFQLYNSMVMITAMMLLFASQNVRTYSTQEIGETLLFVCVFFHFLINMGITYFRISYSTCILLFFKFYLQLSLCSELALQWEIGNCLIKTDCTSPTWLPMTLLTKEWCLLISTGRLVMLHVWNWGLNLGTETGQWQIFPPF